MRQWLVVAIAVTLAVKALPAIWSQRESLGLSDSYRIPFVLSRDYWVAEKHAEFVKAENRILVLGDSVVWGEYVLPQDTLSSKLNAELGEVRFANGGVNGMHPLALEGLVKSILPWRSGQRIIVHLNLLWCSSPERDLQVDKDLSFNHETLVPQWRSIPSYKATRADRLSVTIQRASEFRRWVNHVRIGYFDSKDLHAWALTQPYRNPLDAIRQPIAIPGDELRHEPIPWFDAGIQQQAFSWVAIESSLQWESFQRTIRYLQGKGCEVMVVAGPFNEHLLTPENRVEYTRLKANARQALEADGVPVVDSPLLRSELFGDASHPLAEGYADWAKKLLDDTRFRQWLE